MVDFRVDIQNLVSAFFEQSCGVDESAPLVLVKVKDVLPVFSEQTFLRFRACSKFRSVQTPADLAELRHCTFGLHEVRVLRYASRSCALLHLLFMFDLLHIPLNAAVFHLGNFHSQVRGTAQEINVIPQVFDFEVTALVRALPCFARETIERGIALAVVLADACELCKCLHKLVFALGWSFALSASVGIAVEVCRQRLLVEATP